MSEFVRGFLRRFAIAAAFTVCFALSAILLWEGIEGGKIAHDYSVYWRTAQDPAAAYAVGTGAPFPYAPTMLPWIAPLGLVSRLAGYFLVVGLGAVSLILACRPHLSRSALGLTLISAPFFRCIRNGQVSAILTAALIWACGTRNRIVAGIALGCIASIKPQLVLMAPLMLALNKDWRAFASAALSLVSLVALSLLYGPERWPEWVSSMAHFRSAVMDTNVAGIGITPAMLAQRAGFPPLPFLALGVVAGAWMVFLARNSQPLEQTAAIGAGSLLASPYALSYDLVVIAPYAAMMLMQGRVLAMIPLTAMFNPLPLLYPMLGTWKRAGRSNKTGGVELARDATQDNLGKAGLVNPSVHQVDD